MTDKHAWIKINIGCYAHDYTEVFLTGRCKRVMGGPERTFNLKSGYKKVGSDKYFEVKSPVFWNRSRTEWIHEQKIIFADPITEEIFECKCEKT